MTLIKTTIGRRTFLKSSLMAGGGLMLSFSWMGCQSSTEEALTMPDEWFELNGFLKIGENGMVTIMSPNPEIGQNVKTSMPMIVAEELDADWKNVIVEQAPLNTAIFSRQIAGGSQSLRQSWNGLRMAGASARTMLRLAAAEAWSVPVEEVTTEAGMIRHVSSGKSVGYGELASAASQIPVPEEVELKEVKDFTIIRTPRKNVDGPKIVTGQPLYGLDYTREGMLIAMIVHPPAFGMTLKSVDDSVARQMPGIKDVFSFETLPEDYERGNFDVDAFPKMVAIVGNSTWQVMNAKKALKVEWEKTSDMENTESHFAQMAEMGGKTQKVERRDGNPEAVFRTAAKVIERTYTAPFLAHNTMEPMNFFAHVTDNKAELVGPTQTPEFMEGTVSKRLGIPVENIDVQMTRMGGGFGRRLYGHFMVEAALISQRVNAPIKLIYTREDDMTMGTYRPSYHAYYRAALDENNNLIAFHVRAGGIPESPLAANRFPAGSVDNYLAESWSLPSNISVGAFRAPRSNFIAGAEQSFLDEVAEAAGKDPIAFRLQLLERAQRNPVGENNDYDASRYAGVLELVRDKSNWGTEQPGVYRGVSAYFCHNSYVAHVLDMVVEEGQPVVQKVVASVDCGIVVNPLGATNLVEGGVVDGIGHAMYSALTFKDGAPEQQNFDKYRLIRHHEAPKTIDVHFVQNDIDPTGLGEPPFPPIMGAVANALYKTTGKRYYNQPFMNESIPTGRM